MMMSGQGTVPRAIPADYYESAQEILVVMNPPVGQLVADVPNKNQQNAEQIALTEVCATIATML